MKLAVLTGIFFFAGISLLFAQQRCGTSLYAAQIEKSDPEASLRQQQVREFIKSNSGKSMNGARPAAAAVIRIPVVVHIVYHLPSEDIPDEAVHNQIAALNRDYQRTNDDSANTPEVFKRLAANCNIQFELAKVDPGGRATNGINRIYSPVTRWSIEGDPMKFSSHYGADAWDARYYLNIWVCNLRDLLGYSSLPGSDISKDGVVISNGIFNSLHDGGAYSLGRTSVHEIGHWLSLKHPWGDADCGDDEVADTPPQRTFTTGCPTGIRLSCNNAPNGDMYMNYMDYTYDPCMNLFTIGQRDRIRLMFEPGGPRYSILSSKALGEPWVEGIPLADEPPRWLYPRIYPNPSSDELTIDLKYEPRWIGQELRITNVLGQVFVRRKISSNIETIDISRLPRGYYFVHGACPTATLAEKFIKL